MKGKDWLRVMALSAAVAAALPSPRALAQPAEAGAVSVQEEIGQLQSTLFDSNKSSRERDEAAKRLLQRGANDVLLDALRSGKSDLQVPVARALADQEKPPEVFLPDLMRCLQPQVTVELAEAASQAVANYRDNPAARARLQEFILSGNIYENVRLPAVKALGTLNDKDTARFLVETVLRAEDTQRITPRLSDAAADALGEMTGLTEFGRDVGQWNDWWQRQRGKSREQFIEERRIERERRFSQANAGLRSLASGIDKLMFDLHRQAKDDRERETLVVRLLTDKNPEIRSAGARLVEVERAEGLTVRPTVVAQLRGLIGDSSPDVRQKVAQAIRSINDAAAAKPLLAQLKQERIPSVKAALMAALGPTRDVEAVPELVALLDDPSFQVSEAAARALADLGPEIAKSPQTTRVVANALARTIDRTADLRGSSRLRENAVAAMVPLKDPALVQPLFSLLVDRANNTPTVRRSAIRALGAMNAAPLRNEIAQRIADTSLNDAEAGVRLEAAAALGLIGTPAQANALYAHMDRSREPDEPVRNEAWKSLSSLFNEFTTSDLFNWAGVKFAGMPEKQITVYRILNDKLIQAGLLADVATVREQLGTLYLGANQPADAIPYLQGALDFWDAKPGAKTESIQTSLIQAHLRARHYKDAVQFADARIKVGGNPNKLVMGREIIWEVDRLRKANQFQDALELLKQARVLDLGSYFMQALDERDRDIRSKIPALQDWYHRLWIEVTA